MNIPQELLVYMNATPRLVTEQTGGGCDYIVRHLQCNHTMVLMSNTDAESPEHLDDRCKVVVFEDFAWSRYISFPFRNCREAMNFMSDAEDHL